MVLGVQYVLYECWQRAYFDKQCGYTVSSERRRHLSVVKVEGAALEHLILQHRAGVRCAAEAHHAIITP